MAAQLPSPNTDVLKTEVRVFSRGDFSSMENIGAGGEAVTKKGNSILYGNVCVKIFHHSHVQQGTRKEIELLLKHSSHGNIVRFLGLYQFSKEDPGKKEIGYVMEYMEGDSLHSFIHSPKHYDSTKGFNWILQASRGIQYLHEANIIHRDVKPRNMLLDKSKEILKISDFGIVKKIDSTVFTATKGTYAYMPPEIIASSGDPNLKYDFSVDVYAMGISIWEIFSRRTPFKNITSTYVLGNKIVNGERPEISETLAPAIRDLIKRCWSNNPKERPTVLELIRFSSNKLNEPDAWFKIRPESSFDTAGVSQLRAKLQRMSKLTESSQSEDEEEKNLIEPLDVQPFEDLLMTVKDIILSSDIDFHKILYQKKLETYERTGRLKCAVDQERKADFYSYLAALLLEYEDEKDIQLKIKSFMDTFLYQLAIFESDVDAARPNITYGCCIFPDHIEVGSLAEKGTDYGYFIDDRTGALEIRFNPKGFDGKTMQEAAMYFQCFTQLRKDRQTYTASSVKQKLAKQGDCLVIGCPSLYGSQFIESLNRRVATIVNPQKDSSPYQQALRRNQFAWSDNQWRNVQYNCNSTIMDINHQQYIRLIDNPEECEKFFGKWNEMLDRTIIVVIEKDRNSKTNIQKLKDLLPGNKYVPIVPLAYDTETHEPTYSSVIRLLSILYYRTTFNLIFDRKLCLPRSQFYKQLSYHLYKQSNFEQAFLALQQFYTNYKATKDTYRNRETFVLWDENHQWTLSDIYNEIKQCYAYYTDTNMLILINQEISKNQFKCPCVEWRLDQLNAIGRIYKKIGGSIKNVIKEIQLKCLVVGGTKLNAATVVESLVNYNKLNNYINPLLKYPMDYVLNSISQQSVSKYHAYFEEQLKTFHHIIFIIDGTEDYGYFGEPWLTLLKPENVTFWLVTSSKENTDRELEKFTKSFAKFDDKNIVWCNTTRCGDPTVVVCEHSIHNAFTPFYSAYTQSLSKVVDQML